MQTHRTTRATTGAKIDGGSNTDLVHEFPQDIGRLVMKSVSIVALCALVLAGCDSSTAPGAKVEQTPRLELGSVGPLPGDAPAGPAAVPDFRRRFQVIRAGESPTLDGRLDETAWENAVLMKDFCRTQYPRYKGLPAYAAHKTEARVLYHDKGLYVGVRAFQDPKTITESGSEGWQGGGNEVQVAIDCDLTQFSYYLFRVNPDGA
ncbi:unnamed protein product, partial [marine sediment metagenome]